jgi:UDP-N-acetylmuramate dehydrogenase
MLDDDGGDAGGGSAWGRGAAVSRSAELERELRHAGFRGRLLRDHPLAPYTTWRIGGPAELLAFPADLDDLQTAVVWAAAGGVPWRVLGNGSNLLVHDAGVRGLVLRLRKLLDSVRIEGTRLTAGAGASLPAVARQAAAAGLSGLEFGAGIPGTVGGAIVMNAGWHEFEIANSVATVDVLEPGGALRTDDRVACDFGYRSSRFRREPGVVICVTLALERGDRRELTERLERFAASRKANQPTDLPSCGSVFLKPPGDFAGRLIEAAGLKGLRVGDVQVSPKHANFFINLGSATAADVLALVERVEREVESRFGVRLVREFELW